MISNLQLKNNKYIEIAGKFGRETFQGILFGICSIEYCIWNPELDTLTVWPSDIPVEKFAQKLGSYAWNYLHWRVTEPTGK